MDGYLNLSVRLSQLHLSTPSTIECVGYLLSIGTIEQLRKVSSKFIEHDIALMDHDYGTGCVGEVCMFQVPVIPPVTLETCTLYTHPRESIRHSTQLITIEL